MNNQSFSLSALTSPVVKTKVTTSLGPRTVVYVAGIGGTIFALDGDTGGPLWNRSLKSMVQPRKGGFQGTFLCPNGITATPVIDGGSNSLYVIAPDGSLYGLDLGNGKVNYGPASFVAPFAKSWSLNLVDGRVFTTVSLGCGNGQSGIYAADIRNSHQLTFRQLLLSTSFTAGIWGRGGPVIGQNGKVYGGTADGDSDPTKGDYSDSVIAASAKDLAALDYFVPPDALHLKRLDLDVGSSSPVWFKWKDRNLLAHGFKAGVIYLLDADRLGGENHDAPLFASSRLGNDAEECCDGSGIWGALATSRDDTGERWLFVPMGGSPSKLAPPFPMNHGETRHGSIMAFKVTASNQTSRPALEPVWISDDFQYPDPPVIANGVVFALSNGENPVQRGDESRRYLNTHHAVLKALDAKTGDELYNSGAAISTWVHFSGLAIADGHIYAVDHDSNVYCFGIGTGILTTTLSQPSVDENKGQLGGSWIIRAEHQDQFLRTWILRAGLTAVLALATAIAGIWVALSREQKVGRS